MSVMLDYWHKSIVGDVGKLVDRIRELEAENLRLKQPAGVLQKVERLESGRIHPGMVESDSEWAKAVAWMDADLPRAEKNDAISTANQQIVASLRAMVEASGIPATRRVMQRRKWVDEATDWATTLRVPGDCQGEGTYTLKNRRTDYEERRRKFLEKREAEERQRRSAIEREEAERACQIRLVDVCRSLGLDPVTTTADDAESAIRAKCKYLDLAIAGMQTRGDWSDGCYRVEDALGRFSIDSVTDKDIAEEWAAICADFEDGRSFRDATWNYDRIIGELADKGAVELWSKLRGT